MPSGELAVGPGPEPESSPAATAGSVKDLFQHRLIMRDIHSHIEGSVSPLSCGLGVCRTFSQTKPPHFPLLAGVLSAALSLGAERP